MLQPQEKRAPELLPTVATRLLLIEPVSQDTVAATVNLADVPDIPFDITQVNSLEEAIEKIDGASIDALVWHLPLMDWQILERIASVTDLYPEIPLIVLTDTLDEEFAVESLRYGAQDCIDLEQYDSTRIACTIIHAIERMRATGATCNGYEITERHDWKELLSDLAITHSRLEQEGEKRKRTENALQHERNFTSTILDTIDALVVILDTEGRIVEFNKAFEQVTGYTFSEIHGRNYWDIMLSPEDAEDVMEVFHELQAGDYPNRHENQICRKDGQRRLISWSNTALVNEKNKVVYIFGTGIDITDQRQAEDELWSYYEHLADMVEVRTAELKQANDQLQKEADEHKKTEQRLQHHRDNLEEVVAERTKELKATLLKLDAEIKERKHAEASEKIHMMEAAHIARVNTMGEMISEISHELNQPLAAISIYSDACMRLLASGNAEQEEIVKALQDISNQTKRADQVVKRVREFARRKETRLGIMDINELVQEVMHLIEIETRWHGVELQALMSDPLPKVQADRILIEQVILNLVRNAVEAMDQTPEDKRKLLIRTIANGKNVELSVLDTGHGFSKMGEDGVFEPFATTKENGVGLGLSICKSIIESHRGRLWAESNPEGGAIFHFSLPANSANDE